jgi:hypothetical protein
MQQALPLLLEAVQVVRGSAPTKELFAEISARELSLSLHTQSGSVSVAEENRPQYVVFRQIGTYPGAACCSNHEVMNTEQSRVLHRVHP